MTILAAILFCTAFPARQLVSGTVDGLIAGTDPTNALTRFVDYPSRTPPFASHPVFKPNPRFWAKTVDFSCASPWNSAAGALRAGTLVSKRHIVFAQHFPLATGTRIAFVGGDGEVCVCSIERTKPIPKSDITVGLLDYEVTPNITPAKVLPPDFRAHIGDGSGLPVVTFDQKERVTVSDMDAIPTNAEWRICRAVAPKDVRRQLFSGRVAVGDSGNPAFLVAGGVPILLYVQHGGRYGSGSAMHSFRAEIQKAMDELCPGYKLETFDFSKVGQ